MNELKEFKTRQRAMFILFRGTGNELAALDNASRIAEDPKFYEIYNKELKRRAAERKS